MVNLTYLHQDKVVVKSAVGALPLIWRTKWGDQASHWSTPEAKEATRTQYKWDAIQMCYVSATSKMVQNAEATMDLFPMEELEELEIMKVMEARGLTDIKVPTQCVITNMQFLDEMAKLEDNSTGRAAESSDKGSKAQTMVSKPMSTGGSALTMKSTGGSAMTMHSGEPQGSGGSARTMVSAADTVNQRQPEPGQGQLATRDTRKPTEEEILVTSTLDSDETPDGDKKPAAVEDFQASGKVTQELALMDSRNLEQSHELAKGH